MELSFSPSRDHKWKIPAKTGPIQRGHVTIEPIALDPNDLGASENDSNRSRVKVERTQDTELPIAVA